MTKLTKRNSHAIRVKFARSIEGKRVFYFGSLKDLCEHFSPDILDTTLAKLWAAHAGKGEKIFTKTCAIERVEIIHYLHKNKHGTKTNN